MIFGRRFSRRRLAHWLRGKIGLDRLLQLKTRDREGLEQEAHRLVAVEQFESARRVFELLGLLWPEAESFSRLGQGVCAQRLGNLEDAERAYGEVLALEPSNVYALVNRAEVHLLLGRKEPARADLAAALASLDRVKAPAALRDRVGALAELARESC